MNLIDLAIILLLLVGMVIGYRRGFIMHSVKLISFVAALFVAYRYRGVAEPLLREVLPYPLAQLEGNWIWLSLLNLEGIFYSVLAFLLLFFTTRLVLMILARLLDRLSHLPGLNLANRSLGLVLGAVQMVLIIFVMVHLLFFLPWETGQNLLENSGLASWLIKQSPLLSLF